MAGYLRIRIALLEAKAVYHNSNALQQELKEAHRLLHGMGATYYTDMVKYGASK